MNLYRSSQPRTRLIALLLVLAITAPPLLEARYTPSTGSDAFTRDQEIKLGQQAAAETNKKMPILPDSDPISQYVQQLGMKLASYAPGEKWPYSFHVVNQKEINAFALPGGPIYVNLGTIQAADNEAQLAGVMSHEISHVVQRHATRAATKQMKAQMPLQILGALLGNAGLLGQLAAMGVSFGVGSYYLRNSRQAENEADLLGTDIMYDAGYDPNQMAEFFRKLESQGSAGVQFLSDHPNPGNRVESVSKEVSALPPKHFIEDTPQFDRTKQLAIARKPLTAEQIQQQASAQQSAPGAITGSITPPSQTFKALNTNEYQISYPSNWQVYGDPSSAVTIAPEGGVTQNAVAYGAIVDSFQPETNMSLDEATHQLIANLRQSNPDLRMVGNDEALRVNGREARSQELIGTSPMQQGNRTLQERDWLVATQRQDGSIAYVVFIAPEKDFSALRPTYENMLRSFQVR
jgi:Zn-dependent protease with chaperone function